MWIKSKYGNRFVLFIALTVITIIGYQLTIGQVIFGGLVMMGVCRMMIDDEMEGVDLALPIVFMVSVLLIFLGALARLMFGTCGA